MKALRLRVRNGIRDASSKTHCYARATRIPPGSLREHRSFEPIRCTGYWMFAFIIVTVAVTISFA